MKSRSKPKLVWAVDPFNDDQQLTRSSAMAARLWQKTRNSEIVPVYVLSSRQIGFAYEFEFDSIDFISNQAVERFSSLVRRFRIPSLRPLTVLSTHSWTQVHDAEVLRDFSNRIQAESVLIATHGRKGINRGVLGSFAEALLLHSNLPVVTVNPKSALSPRIQRVLFPTEFGKYSSRALEQVAHLAKELQAAITFLHVIPKGPAGIALGTPFGFPRLYPYSFTEAAKAQKSWAESSFRDWSERCAQEGVKARYQVITAANGIADAILAFAREDKTQLIAIETESGRIRAALLGSVCRTLVREAPCPVWSIRPTLALGVKKAPTPVSYEVAA